jgi:fermentation-respiration switch protein FrsA (DUF1100 family)
MIPRMLLPALNLFLFSILVLIVIVPFFYAFANIYRPKVAIQGSPKADGLSFDPISFSASDGQTLYGWFLHGRMGAPLIVVCHGAGTNREDLRGVSRFLCQAGFHVLSFDFRSHGESPGRKTTFGFKEALDVEAAVRFAQKDLQNNFRGVGVYAISMGSSAVILASPKLTKVKAFVFDSPFARLSDLVESQYALLPTPLVAILSPLTRLFGSILMGVRIETVSPEDFVHHVGQRPVLVFHGVGDTLIPISQGRRLFEKLTGPKEFVTTPGAGHVESYLVMGKAYEDKVVHFFQQHLEGASDEP